MSADEFPRALAFMRSIDERAARRTEPFQFGVACFDEEHPAVWERNVVWVDVDSAQPEAAELADAVELLQGGAGLPHRKVLFPGAHGLADRLVALGWSVRAMRVMAHRGPPPPVRGDAELVSPAALRNAREEILSGAPLSRDPEVVRQLLQVDRLTARAVEVRCYATFERDAVAAFCLLYSNGETAQIEDVNTLPRFRRRGKAGIVVSRAVADARAEHRLTFLRAYADDWVAAWYGRLGFEDLGTLHEAVRVRARRRVRSR